METKDERLEEYLSAVEQELEKANVCHRDVTLAIFLYHFPLSLFGDYMRPRNSGKSASVVIAPSISASAISPSDRPRKSL